MPRPLKHNNLLVSGAIGIALLLAGCGGEKTVTPPPDVSCADVGDICTMLGTGVLAQGHDEMPPLETDLYYPIDLTFDSEGRLLVLDWNNQYVRRLDKDGLVRVILGTGFEDYVVDGSPALETSLHHAYSFCYDAAGNLFLAGFHVSQIIRLGTDDRVWIVAGKETNGYTGDGGDPLQAEMEYPCGVAVASSGYPIFIADTYNSVIRVINQDGIIRTIAGQGKQRGYAGDGGPAADALLDHPYRIRYHEATGDLYICDRNNNVVRKIDSAGIITTVAGTGTAGYNGDGIPATQAQLYEPLDAKIGPDGALYIADTENNRVRRVDPSGTISTFAGTGVEGYSGDGGPAEDAELYNPRALQFDSEGNLWISDSGNSVIRKIQLVEP